MTQAPPELPKSPIDVEGRVVDGVFKVKLKGKGAKIRLDVNPDDGGFENADLLIQMLPQVAVTMLGRMASELAGGEDRG